MTWKMSTATSDDNTRSLYTLERAMCDLRRPTEALLVSLSLPTPHTIEIIVEQPSGLNRAIGRTSRKDRYLTLAFGLLDAEDRASAMHAAAHELGHVVIFQAYDDAPPGLPTEYLAERLGWRLLADAGWDVCCAEVVTPEPLFPAIFRGHIYVAARQVSIGDGLEQHRNLLRMVEYRLARSRAYELGRIHGHATGPVREFVGSLRDALDRVVEPLAQCDKIRLTDTRQIAAILGLKPEIEARLDALRPELADILASDPTALDPAMEMDHVVARSNSLIVSTRPSAGSVQLGRDCM